MKDARLDQHLVIHDVFTLAFASACGAIGAAAGESLEIGVLMMGSVLTLGVLLMRVRPFRRTVNRLALLTLKAAGTVVSK